MSVLERDRDVSIRKLSALEIEMSVLERCLC